MTTLKVSNEIYFLTLGALGKTWERGKKFGMNKPDEFRTLDGQIFDRIERAAMKQDNVPLVFLTDKSIDYVIEEYNERRVLN